MSYKYSTGSVRRGDIYYEDDREGQPTYIDFGTDTITLRPSGSQILHAAADAVGIGTTNPDQTLEVAGNVKVAGDDPRVKIDGDTDSHPGLELYENGTRKWIVYNNYTNDNLTFKTNSDNIMSITQTGRVGVGTQAPSTTFSVAGSLSLNVTAIDKNNNNSSTYTVGATDYAIFANTRPAAQNGINSALTITLPLAGDYPGRILVLKDAGGYVATNSITIQRAGSDMIDGSQTSIVISNDNDAITLMSNGGTMWFTL